MWRRKAQSADTRFGARTGFTTLLLALLALLAACGSVSSKAKATVTPVPPTATPPPKGWNAVASPPVGSRGQSRRYRSALRYRRLVRWPV